MLPVDGEALLDCQVEPVTQRHTVACTAMPGGNTITKVAL